MSDFVWCHGPGCHKSHTQDRIRGVKGSKVLRTRKVKQDQWNTGQHMSMYSYFCSQACKLEWLSVNMENIEHGRPIEFIRHRRESQGYAKVENDNRWGASYSIERVDNRTELD